MSGYLAVFRHTAKTLFRSFSYLLASFLSFFSAFLLPYMITSSNDAVMQFELAINYTLGAISTIIFLCCIWSACSITARDIESYTVHMIVSKPLRKSNYFLGRFTGVAFAYLLCLFIALIIFNLSIRIMPNLKSIQKGELNELNEKVFAAKKSYLPLLENLPDEINSEVENILKIAKKENQTFTSDEIAGIKNRAYYSVLAKNGEVPPDSSKEFFFQLLEIRDNASISLVFTPYIGAISVMEKQKRDSISGDWFISVNDGIFEKIPFADNKFFSNEKYTINLQKFPAYEKPAKVVLKFANYDKNQSVFFRLNENPLLLVNYCSFFENLSRTAFIIGLGTILMCAIGCALGSFLSLPIAIFAIIFYIIFGTLSSYILSDEQFYKSSKTLDMKIGYSVSRSLVQFISPMQSFQPTEQVSSGKLLETGTIVKIVKKYFIFQLIISILFGIYLFYKRELGMVIRK